MTMSIDKSVEWIAAKAPHTAAIARIGLGLVILFAGIHKLVDPMAWAVYIGSIMEAVLPVSPVVFMLINGVLEPPFAIALLADRYTVYAAAFVTVSLAATTLYIAFLGLATGRFVDILIRDLGLTALAATVTIQAAAARTARQTSRNKESSNTRC